MSAAGAVAAAHGLTCDGTTIISSGSNVLVRLRPAPVVARVMTGTVALHDDPRRWLAREVSVLEFLAPSGLAVAPSARIAPGPHHHDGLWMTFTESISDIEPPADLEDAHRLGCALRELHDAMRPFDGDLGGLRDLRDDVERLHGRLAPGDAGEAEAIRALRVRLDAVWARVLEPAHPVQALHGDVSLGNLLQTPRRLIWNDFEDTFRGPLHWDLAGWVMSLRARGAGATFIARMLAAYGWDDERELVPFYAAHASL